MRAPCTFGLASDSQVMHAWTGPRCLIDRAARLHPGLRSEPQGMHGVARRVEMDEVRTGTGPDLTTANREPQLPKNNRKKQPSNDVSKRGRQAMNE